MVRDAALASKPVFSIQQIHGVDTNGLPTFYFIRVDPLKIRLLEAAVKQGNFNANDFGEVLCSGYGQPSEEDITFMKRHYHYDVKL